MSAFAAYNCRIDVSGTSLRGNSVTVSAHADMLDVTHFDQALDVTPRSNGYGSYIAGVQDCEVSVDAHWFSEDNPYGGALVIRPGTVLLSVTITLDTVNAAAMKSFSFSRLIIESVEHTESVRDTIHYVFRCKNEGRIFVWPT